MTYELDNWNSGNADYNSKLTISNSVITVTEPSNFSAKFSLKATTLGLKTAIRKFNFKIIDCIDQELKSKHPDGIEFNFNPNDGVKTYSKSEYEISKLFTWGESLCPVTKLSLQKSDKYATDIVSEGLHLMITD